MKKAVTNQDRSTYSGLVWSGISAIALILVFSGGGAAQSGVRHNDYQADKTLRSNARVNPSTLAMELSIPLAVLPGRAGNSVPIEISYSSKVWEFKTLTAPRTDAGIAGRVLPRYATHSAAGWTSTSSVPRIDYDQYEREIYYVPENGDPQAYVPGDSPDNVQLFYVKRVRVVMAGGASVEFRKDDAVYSRGVSPSPSAADKTGTFLAVDGSRMRLVMGSPATVLYLPDGGRYIFTGSATAQTFIDRHGNRTALGETQMTDTLGRAVTNPIPLPFNSNQTLQTEQTAGVKSYFYPGIGAAREFKLVWGQLNTVLDSGQALMKVGSRDCNQSPPVTVADALFQSNGFLACGGHLTFDPVVLAEVRLPDGAAYRFKYNSYGEITRIDYPTGGYERFEYGYVPPVGTSTSPYSQSNRGVKYRWVGEGGAGATEQMWTYTATRNLTNYQYLVKTINPDLSFTEQLIYDEPDDAPNIYGFSNASVGRAYDTKSYAANGALAGRTLTGWAQTGSLTVNGVAGYPGVTRDLRVNREVSIIFDPINGGDALAAMSETEYDTAGSSDPQYFSALNAKQTKSYHYVAVGATAAQSANLTTATATGWFTGATPANLTETDYLYDADYLARNINGLVSETRVKDGGGVLKARTHIAYDEAGYALSSTGALPTAAANSWLDPLTELGAAIGSRRGLPTSVRSYSDIAVNPNLYIETHSFYDQYGNPRKMRDGRGFETEIQYDAANAFAYPTKTISPIPGGNGSQAAFETTVIYDYTTGLPTSTKDANNLETRMEYNDALLRPTKVQQYFGGLPVGAASETIYGAGTSEATRYVKSRTQIDETKWKEGYSWYDGLGRGIKTQSVDSSGDVFALTCYDAYGRLQKASNPFRNVSNATCTSTNLEWTATAYDNAGRAWKTTTPDGAVVQTDYALATTGDTFGTAVTVTDQALKQRRSITNALGQLERVDEPTDSNGLGAINSPNQPTYYIYDILNNLTTVVQGGQTRTFVYDSLSRLKSATNPEMGTTATNGTIQYQYDNNGNLTKKTDARLVETNYGYDAINRVTSRTYTNEPTGQTATPSVSYFYDTLPNAKGKLTKVTATGTGTNAFTAVTDYQAFDTLGRVTQSQQTIDGVTYGSVSQTYTYNLSGALIEEKYPSGRVVRNVLDTDGDLSIVQSKKNANAGYWNYAKSFSYTAAGAVSSMQLGNGKWESTQFNSRLQPTQIALGGTQNATNLLKLNFAYNTPNSTTDNNGNVISQTITTPSETHGTTTYSAFVATQVYNYDALNRLKSAEESSPTQPGWKQTYLYDRFGNRNFDTGSDANGLKTNTLPLNCATAVCNPAVDPTTNKLVGYVFDNAGNTKTDANGQTFIYDAENHQTLVKNGSNVVIGEYFYDGDGKRVKKIAGSEVTIFVYDAGGKLVAEYANQIAATPQVSYLTSDHLGSPRINTDANGVVISRHDYQPFGEEVTRTSYGGDEVRKQFTSYERDNETDLDFAQARYHNYNLGRFNSPDPLYFQFSMAIDPQRFNLYGYARNNPLKWIDPNGESLHLRGNTGFLTTDVLYEQAGGQEEFEKYFHIVDGQVLANNGVDSANGNEGIRFLGGLVGASENYVYFAGTSFDELSKNYDGYQDQSGKSISISERGRANFTAQFEGGLGNRRGLPVYATSGRAGTFPPKKSCERRCGFCSNSY